MATINEGAIGDVKYSVLEPDKFVQVNGKGWVLMDKRGIVGSKLYELTDKKLGELPDARGVFIRGKNSGREGITGDPAGEREIGSYQEDAYKSKSLSVKMGKVCTVGSNEVHKGLFSMNTTTQEVWPLEGYWISNGGENEHETRPRNIALYIYIKIN